MIESSITQSDGRTHQDQPMDTIEKNSRRWVKVGDMIRCKESHLDNLVGIVTEIRCGGMPEFDVVRIAWNDGVKEDWSLQEFLSLHRIIK